ncbi:efflux transporter outer membrane subunit [Ramlibacter sp. AN1015]|uniref:efflux transporter outer membrane subunit n=1 Tax=Ramlibacter sp. AN1015 TaxID=3133428 RepID=UPI0030C3BBB6
MTHLRWAAALALPLWLGACAVARPPTAPNLPAPLQWQAPLPHGGEIASLRAWWRQFNDPLLAELVDAGQEQSPTVDAARARIAQAAAARAATAAALLPGVDGAASVTRGNAQPPLPLATTAQLNAQAAWEIDLFGARANEVAAAEARLRSAQAGWHEARISIAADTAASYFRLRTCQWLLEVTGNDVRSRTETARLTQLSAEAGFTPPATAALARATAAEGRARLTQQRAQCDQERKTLVALTGVPESQLRERLAGRPAPTLAALFAIESLPAQVLAQRPDIYQAEQAVAAASAEVGSARAALYPRLSLTGSIAAGVVRASGTTSDAQTWAIGPLAISVPLFDAGRREANVQGAIGRYDEAAAVYRARVRQAVAEVERALVALDSARAREDEARAAVQDFRGFYQATEARQRNGLASLVELEDARRDLLAAETGLVSLYGELQAAWTSLYRAAGGGWDRGDSAASLASRP